MGALQHINSQPPRSPWRLNAWIGALALSLLASSAASANETAPRAEFANPTPALETPVSSSPNPPDGRSLTQISAQMANPQNRPALTRAAAQQRIDAMSPVEWLSSYGEVTVQSPN